MTNEDLLSRRFALERTIEGPLGAVLIPFVNYLRPKELKVCTVKRYLAALVHFSNWAAKRPDFSIDGINEVVIGQFLHDHFGSNNSEIRRTRGRYVRASMRHLLSVLRQEQIIENAPSKISAPITTELEEFNHHMVNVRGLAPSTCAFRLKHVQDFLVCEFNSDKIDIARISPEDLQRYVMRFADRWSPVSMKKLRDSLRSYLRFRAFQGDRTEALEEALPVIASWKRPALPKSLTEDQVKKFLQAFDQSYPIGKRDYAIARCLLDLGLRGDKVTNLCLESMNWREGVVTVSGGKGRRTQQLPLPTETGTAIAAYLRDGRPQSNNRALFVRHVVPFDKPLTVQAIRNAVIRAFVRAGMREQFCGTHVLRHTMAVRLQRSGASLKEIADLLRHKSFEATKIYARVDIEALQAMALPWPRR